MLLWYKCAVCLELKFVAVFSCPNRLASCPCLALLPHPVWPRGTTVFQFSLPWAFLAGLGICTAREDLSRGVGSLPGHPTFAPQDLCLQSCRAPGACIPPPSVPQTSHTARFTSRGFHPLLITLEHARTESADWPIRGACVISARRPPALSSGSRRRQAAAAGIPARARAPPPGPPGLGPRRRAAWSGR